MVVLTSPLMLPSSFLIDSSYPHLVLREDKRMSLVECLYRTYSGNERPTQPFSNLCGSLWSISLRSHLRRGSRSMDRMVSVSVYVHSSVLNVSRRFDCSGTFMRSNDHIQIKERRVLPASTRDGGRTGPNRWSWSWWRWWWEQLKPSQEFRVLIFEFGLLVILMRFLRPLAGPEAKAALPVTRLNVPYSEFLHRVNTNQVEKVDINGPHMRFKLRSHAVKEDADSSDFQEAGTVVENIKPSQMIVYTTIRPPDIETNYEKMLENGVEFGIPDNQSDGYLNIALISLLHAALLVGLLHQSPVGFSARQSKDWKSRGSSISQVADLDEAIVKFSDVAGVNEAKEELQEIVEFIRSPDRYTRVGARPPRGVLLVSLHPILGTIPSHRKISSLLVFFI
ncbi:hypothetical protein SAY86_008416 [Trapa natans]|uniref:Peptidase M41 FtsH extracellular domain-containing protein n=1 Tax=Trapa natans TaxID=22666 RepID=A0AAN7QAX3_TRANT|nr:hypothetical protein SAY86_008416 [Trapa natans]